MKFTPALLLAAAGFAAAQGPNSTAPDPSTYENVDVTEFSVRESYGNGTQIISGAVATVESVDFLINGNTTCSADFPGTDGTVFVCGSTPYRFGLVNGTNTDYGLRIYKQTSPFAGWYGSGDIETYCRSGGNTIEICDQVYEANTIVISAP